MVTTVPERNTFLAFFLIYTSKISIFFCNSFSFKRYQEFKVMNARNWSPFQIGRDQYFVVANYMGGTCPIFRYNSTKGKFENQLTGIECRETVDLKPFKLDGEQHIVVANHADSQPVVVWKWNGRRFTKRQEIHITATYVEVFDVNGDKFIAISGKHFLV